MDEFNIYESTFDKNRRVTEETDKEMAEQQKQTDAEKTRMDRRRRRAERRSTCRCDQRSGSRSRRRKRRILSQNPFIIFYLEMYYKMPDKHVTEVARQAGKEWCALPEEERKKYLQLAESVRRRRRRTTRRRRGCQRNETSGRR